MKTLQEIQTSHGELQDLPEEVGRFAEVQQEHAKNSATIAHSYKDALDEIRAINTLEGPYVDRLDGGQYRAALRELKETQAEEKRAKCAADYEAELVRHEQNVAALRQPLQQRLYGLSEAGTAAIPGLAASSPETVAETLEVAIMSGNKDLARAAFAIASHRGLGDVQSRYFNEVDPDARPVYESYLQLPGDEQLAERRRNVARLFPNPSPEYLMPPAKGTT